MTSMKIVQFSRPPPPLLLLCPSASKILPLPWPWTSNFKWTLLPLQMITSQLKENIIQGWILYVIRSILQIGFRFQYQLISLVSLSFNFFSFSWSLSICFFVALYSCACSFWLCGIIHIFSTLSCLIEGGSNKMLPWEIYQDFLKWGGGIFRSFSYNN